LTIPLSKTHRSTGGSTARTVITWVAILMALVASVIAFSRLPSGEPVAAKRTYAEFLDDVRDDRVASVSLGAQDGSIKGAFVDETTFVTQGPAGALPDADLRLLQTHDVARTYARQSSPWGWVGGLTTLVLPLVMIVALWVWFSRRSAAGVSGATAFGGNPGHVYTTERPPTNFDDVAGYEAVKADIREVVEFLRDPAKFQEIGARIPKGVLLVGPPGTGKTLIARAVAGEADVPFISVTGSHFMEMFVGVGAARVRGLFDTARKNAPSIVFVDEIASTGRRRGATVGPTHDERDQTLNQLLAEMDGFDTSERIVVLAATNRPDILDPALLRAGRFDRQVLVPLPTLEERTAILRVHSRDKKMGPDIDLALIARATPGMSGADLANLVNEAALGAVRSGSTEIRMSHIDAARDRVVMGLQRTSMALSETERWMIARHEAGHAVLAQLLAHADPVHKVTILPSGLALGATQQMPTNERHLYERQYLLDTMAVQLGGRTAEELLCDDISTGAANDLTTATQMARRMVTEWGMSDALGPMAWEPQNPYATDGLAVGRECSERTADLVDSEVERILGEQRERARMLLGDHIDALAEVAEALVEHETLDGAAVARIVDGSRAEPVSHSGVAASPS
jgi:cell division protease FtsH